MVSAHSKNRQLMFFIIVLFEVFLKPELEGEEGPDLGRKIDLSTGVGMEKFFDGLFPE